MDDGGAVIAHDEELRLAQFIKRAQGFTRALHILRERDTEPEPIVAFAHPKIEPRQEWRSEMITVPRRESWLLVGAMADSLRDTSLALLVGLRVKADYITDGMFVVWVPPRQMVELWLRRVTDNDMLAGDASVGYEAGYATLWGWRLPTGAPQHDPSWAPDVSVARSELRQYQERGYQLARDTCGKVHVARKQPSVDDPEEALWWSLCFRDGMYDELDPSIEMVNCSACMRYMRYELDHAVVAQRLLAMQALESA